MGFVPLSELEGEVAVVVMRHQLDPIALESKRGSPCISHAPERPGKATARPEQPREESGDDAAMGDARIALEMSGQSDVGDDFAGFGFFEMKMQTDWV